MPPILTVSDIKVRILIISDTHASPSLLSSLPTMPVDVVIHCGNLTQESKLSEFASALALLKAINAPLKLAIPGNHDFTLDNAVCVIKTMEPAISSGVDLEEEIYQVYGKVGQPHQVFCSEQAKKDG